LLGLKSVVVIFPGKQDYIQQYFNAKPFLGLKKDNPEDK